MAGIRAKGSGPRSRGNERTCIGWLYSVPCLLSPLAAKRRRSHARGILKMIDFAAARRMMVDGQVRTSDVTDPRIIAAMLEIPRERFVPQANADLAYLDFDVPAAEAERGKPARRLLKPMVLAKLVQAAAVGASDHVLDVGCASGYSSALLARLAGSVTALEEEEALIRAARENLKAIGADNVTVAAGPLTQGWQGAAPYDVILLNGATDIAPDGLTRQLKAGGRLAAILARAPTGQAMLYRSVGGDVSGWPIFDAPRPCCRDLPRPPPSCSSGFYASFTQGVARKHQAPSFLKTVISTGGAGVPQPNYG